MFRLGDAIRFHYRAADWEWLPETFGPLGPLLPPERLPEVSGRSGTVIMSPLPSAWANRHIRADGRPWVMVRMHDNLGFSVVEEYDDDELTAEGWTESWWPTDLPVPGDALTLAKDLMPQPAVEPVLRLRPVVGQPGDCWTRLLGVTRGR